MVPVFLGTTLLSLGKLEGASIGKEIDGCLGSLLRKYTGSTLGKGLNREERNAAEEEVGLTWIK